MKKPRNHLLIEADIERDRAKEFKVSYFQGNGQTIVKKMTVDELAYLLNHSSVKEEEEKSLTAETPPEYLGNGLIRYGTTITLKNGAVKEERFSFALVLKKEHTGFLCLGQPVYVPQPRRLIFYSSNGEINIFALKDGEVAPHTPLWWYPLGHVTNGGSVCKGNVPMKASAIEEAKKKITDFFIADCLGHYYQQNVTVKKDWSYSKLMNELQKKETFPDEILQPARMFNGKDLTFELARQRFLKSGDAD